MLTHTLPLPGCTPEPLMNYLKALGVLRLVAQQVDPTARGCWKHDQFILRSKLDEGKLLEFFLHRYRPTAIIAPWGARSGFFAGSSEGAARTAIAAISKAEDERFESFKDGVGAVKKLLIDAGLNAKAEDEEKIRLLFECRDRLPDAVLPWLDACYVLTGAGRKFPPLLGTGGNEGSGSYVSGFAQQVVACLIEHAHDGALTHALFGTATPGISGGQMPGHFSPRNSGGANASQGFTGPISTNSWDYLLALEGACLWASGVVRKFGISGRSMAAFPFTVNVSAAGAPSFSSNDARKPKQAKREVAEMWLPIWERPVTSAELSGLLAEGRAVVGRRSADNGLDFARAAAGLGVDRGITAFERIAFLMRNGQSFMGVSMGRVPVRARSQVDLLRELDKWLTSYRVACGDKAPVRFATALRRLDRAIFEYCRYGGDAFFQAILVAVGAAEKELARGETFRFDAKQDRVKVRPLTGLSRAWLDAAMDDTAECEIALALASIGDWSGKVGPLRANLEAFDWNKGNWSSAKHSVVWHSAGLVANLAAVLERRVLDAGRLGCPCLPLAGATPASLVAVAQFLVDERGDERISELLWGFLPVEISSNVQRRGARRVEVPLPRAYSLLKLCLLPEPIEIDGKKHAIKPEPALLALLEANRIGEACEIALRRLRVSGLRPLGERRVGTAGRELTRELGSCSGFDGRRLAAALLIPISTGGIRALCRQILRLKPNKTDTLQSA